MEEYLCQSLPYLEDTQATIREAAVGFIGKLLSPGSLFWQPCPRPPPPPPQGPPCRWAWACWGPWSVPPPLGTVLPWGQPC